LVKVFGESASTIKGKLILAYLHKLSKPPRPVPKDCVVCIANVAEPQLPLYEYKSQENCELRYRTFLLMGFRQVGKTALLDAVANCLDNVSFTDPWRWKVANENNIEQKFLKVANENNVEQKFLRMRMKRSQAKISYYYIEDKRELKNEAE